MTSRYANNIIQMLIERNYLITSGTSYRLAQKGWESQWRLLNLPKHSDVRRLSFHPIIQADDCENKSQRRIQLSVRHPALPVLDIFIGDGDKPPKGIERRKGIEFLRTHDGLYIGKSGNISERMIDHKRKRKPAWWFFASPKEHRDLDGDTLEVTESLLIAFWNEIAVVESGRFRVHEPEMFSRLQEAILMVETMSASLLWLIRDGRKYWPNDISLDLPFKRWIGRGWSKGRGYFRNPVQKRSKLESPNGS